MTDDDVIARRTLEHPHGDVEVILRRAKPFRGSVDMSIPYELRRSDDVIVSSHAVGVDEIQAFMLALAKIHAYVASDGQYTFLGSEDLQLPGGW